MWVVQEIAMSSDAGLSDLSQRATELAYLVVDWLYFGRKRGWEPKAVADRMNAWTTPAVSEYWSALSAQRAVPTNDAARKYLEQRYGRKFANSKTASGVARGKSSGAGETAREPVKDGQGGKPSGATPGRLPAEEIEEDATLLELLAVGLALAIGVGLGLAAARSKRFGGGA